MIQGVCDMFHHSVVNGLRTIHIFGLTLTDTSRSHIRSQLLSEHSVTPWWGRWARIFVGSTWWQTLGNSSWTLVFSRGSKISHKSHSFILLKCTYGSIVPCAMMYQKLQAVPWELSQPCHATLSSALSSLHSDLRGSTVHRRRAASLPGFLEDIGICAVLRCRDELCLAAAGAGLGEGQDVVAPLEAPLWGLQSHRNAEVHGLRQRRFEAFESVDFLQTYAVHQGPGYLFSDALAI